MKKFIKALAGKVMKIAEGAGEAAQNEAARRDAEKEAKAEREAFSMLIGYNALVAYGVKQLGQEGGAK